MRMHSPKSSWRLACFDLDGTLVLGTSVCLHLAEKLGHLDCLKQLEAQYASGEISNALVADGIGPYYAGRSLAAIEVHLSTVPIIKGVPSVLATLADKGIESLICTVSWRFVAQILAKRFGFVDASGCEMHMDENGLLTGQVSKHFDEFDKLEFVKAHCAERQIPLSQVFAVGDSRSDIPLFGAVGFSVALNATDAAKAAASVAIETDDLGDVLQVIPGLKI
jgi:phosphoserine phosphatase